MVVEAQRLPVETLARAAAEVAGSGDLRSALGAIARAAAEATRADLVVLRVLDAEGQFVARAMAPEGSALGAEVAGTRAACEAVLAGEVPEPTRRAAERVGAAGVLVVLARAAGRGVGSVELVPIGDGFGGDDRALARTLAEEDGLLVRTGSEYGLDGYVRITVGPPELMERVAAAIGRVTTRPQGLKVARRR